MEKHPETVIRKSQGFFNAFERSATHFLNQKKAYFDNLDASYDQNLVTKEAILVRLNEFKLSDDHKVNYETLKNFGNEWKDADTSP